MATRKTAPVEKTSIELVQFQDWLLVRDVDTYRTLLGIGLPLSKIHQKDTLPIIQPLLRKAGIRIKSKPFIEEYEEFFEKIRGFIKKPDHVRVQGAKFAIFLPSEKACSSLQTKLEAWFKLRSFAVQFLRRERDGKWKLIGEVSFDRNIQPIYSQSDKEDTPTILDVDVSNELAFYVERKPVPLLHIRWNAKAGGGDEPIMVKDIPLARVHRHQLIELAGLLLSAVQHTDEQKGSS